jgi:hypothetical protein
MSFYTIIALDIARERAREADRARLANLARAGRPARPSIVRTSTARAFAALSRGSASVVRHLDAGVAEDLQHGLAHAK